MYLNALIISYGYYKIHICISFNIHYLFHYYNAFIYIILRKGKTIVKILF